MNEILKVLISSLHIMGHISYNEYDVFDYDWNMFYFTVCIHFIESIQKRYVKLM